MSPQRRAGLLLVAGVVLFVAGFAVALLVPGSDASFGWFAYTPLTSTDVMAGLLFFDSTRWAGAVVGIVGLVAAGWAAGFLAGRRRPSES